MRKLGFPIKNSGVFLSKSYSFPYKFLVAVENFKYNVL